MSQWTDIRDSLLEAVKIEEVTEEMKQNITKWALETGLPIARKAADDFCQQVKDQAKSEKGWCKVRDLFVLPTLVNIGLWITKKALQKSITA